MKHATSTLSGALLDQAVALALGEPGCYVEFDTGKTVPAPAYSTDFAHGGPLLNEHIDAIERTDIDEFWARCLTWADGQSLGGTVLIAAMRAIVASKIGAGCTWVMKS